MPSAGSLFASAALLVSAFARPQSHQVNPAKTSSNSKNAPVNSDEQSLYSAPTHNFGGSAAGNFHSPAFIPHGQNLRPQLPQSHSNGNSQLGTFHAPHLPGWLGGGPMSGGSPWGGRSAGHTNPYQNLPNTGVTRHYDFTLTEATIAPDGVERPGQIINGAFPGPTIEANWGDWIEVVVHNQLTDGTSLHWHGLLQQETPWFDGVPAVDQCPIAPGSTFTYRFRADLYGTSWYHSHYSAQFTGGLFGPMIIYGPHENAEYDVDLGPVMVNDWFHTDWFQLVEQVMAPFVEKVPPPFSNNVLINGKMNYPCAETNATCTPNAGVSKFSFQSGKTYRLRVINSGAEGMQKFSIDNHKMTVIANDFTPIVPYEADVLTLGVGQRSDIIVKATGKPTDAVWMRSELGPNAFQGGCSLPDGISPTGVAAIYYENADQDAVPTTNSSVPLSALTYCENDALSETVPYYSLTPTSNPQSVQNIDITYAQNETTNLFFMNNSTFRANFNDPVLLDAKLGHTTFPAEYNVYDFGESNSIRLVVYNHAITGAHPMHLHGHNMYVLQVGTGTWDGSITNAQNPQRRDVQILPNAPSATEPAYIVVQIDADNPGVWPFHCHIAWHVSAGLYVNILERPRDIQREMQIPGIMAQTCRDWSAFTGNHVVDEIDSGL